MHLFRPVELMLAAVLCAAISSGCATTPAPDPGGAAAELVVPDGDERALGALAHAALVARGIRPVRDEAIIAYVEAVFARLTPAAHADRPLEYRLHVFDDPLKVTTFSTAGGHVYISTGLLLAADNDAEVAVALAHELGHLAARHPLSHFLQGYGMGRSAALSLRKNPARRAAAVAWLAHQGPDWKHRPSEERLADTWGLRYAWRGGYDARALQTLLTRLAADAGDAWLNTHPVDERRINHLSRVVKQGRYDRGTLGQGRLEAVQRLIARDLPTQAPRPVAAGPEL